jgi:intracellular sulfur oxidation DsrE/DsrF family protein
MKPNETPETERRSFLSRLNWGAAVAALAFGARAAAQDKAQAKMPFEPARYAKDEWMDEIPGKHRIVFDTTSDPAMGDALQFATNYLAASRSDYGLQNSDMAVIVVARHRATAYAYNNALWAKYGEVLGPQTEVKGPAQSNPRWSGGFGVESLIKSGLHFAVCGFATARLAGSIAQATGAKREDIIAEINANLVPNAHMTAAGIVALSRAQEHGYTVVKA